MKSSTIRRSTLSRETMEVIENLSKEQEESGLPSEYVRPDELDDSVGINNGSMSQEIDLLWQNFKTNQFNTNSPVVHLFIGIVIGVVLTSSIFVIHSIATKDNSDSSKAAVGGIEKLFSGKEKVQEPTLEEQASIQQVIPSDSESSVSDSSSVNTTEETQQASSNATQEVASGSVDTSSMTKYKVKSGDTIESIIKQHYGTYSPDKAEQIMQVNNMKSLDHINIDQEILLP